MSDDNQSTVQSYVDSATGLGQRAVNSVTGGSSSQGNESQNSGSWDQTLGSAKESLGNVTGSENLRRQGIEQNNAGKDAEARGHLEALGNSATDRAQGAIGSVGAAVKGDREEEDKWRQVHDEGKGRQKGVEDTIDKRF